MVNLRKSLRKRAGGSGKPFAGLALAAVLCFPIPGNTQNTQPAQNTDITRAELAGMNQFLEAHPEISEQLQKNPSLVNNEEFVEAHPSLQQYLQQHPETREEIQENPSAFMQQEERFDRREDAHDMRWKLAATDQFLDAHPEMAQDLRKNPSLINDEEFVKAHPELQEFLQQHPEIREDWKQNPSMFMQEEQGFERHEDQRGQWGRLATTDRFLDAHPEIAEQVRKDPSLLNNKKFVEDHPALQEFLQQHPEIRDEVRENPNAFMQQEDRYDRGEYVRDDDGHGQRGRLAATTDRFLDAHPEIAEQVRKDPSLLDNQKFVTSHPALQQFLQLNPEIRQEAQVNPSAFMQQQQQYEQREGDSARTSMMQPGTNQPGTARPEPMHSGANFGEFLGSHSGIAQQLSQDPSLVNNKQYLEQHPDLQQYLRDHPEATRQFNENPSAFMSSFQSNASTSATTGSKPKQ